MVSLRKVDKFKHDTVWSIIQGSCYMFHWWKFYATKTSINPVLIVFTYDSHFITGWRLPWKTWRNLEKPWKVNSDLENLKKAPGQEKNLEKPWKTLFLMNNLCLWNYFTSVLCKLKKLYKWKCIFTAAFFQLFDYSFSIWRHLLVVDIQYRYITVWACFCYFDWWYLLVKIEMGERWPWKIPNVTLK